MDTLLQQLQLSLSTLPQSGRYLLAFSGGIDSHVLLHALRQLQCGPPSSTVPRIPAIVALHVHHGLHEDADHWTRHCRRVCDELQLELRVLSVDAAPGPGVSPEEAARDARYTALFGQMLPGDALLTAHHQDDQAETLLLQLLRGSGPHGLAAMPRASEAGPGHHLRPLLALSRGEIHDYARHHGLQWVEDSSNADTGYDRNFIRHRVLPTLEQRWPAAAATLSRCADHCADAAQLIDECAGEDLRLLQGAHPDQLSLTALLQLQEARRRNLLRAWLRSLGLPLPSTAQMQRIVNDLLPARADATPLVQWPGAEIRRYRDSVYAMAPLPAHDPGQMLEWDITRPLELPALGSRLRSETVSREGLDAGLLSGGRVTVRFRTGGERCHPAGRGGSHDLKKLFQERGVPPWLRARIPLIYVDGELAAVTGMLVCEGFRGAGGRRMVLPRLEPLAG